MCTLRNAKKLFWIWFRYVRNFWKRLRRGFYSEYCCWNCISRISTLDCRPIPPFTCSLLRRLRVSESRSQILLNVLDECFTANPCRACTKPPRNDGLARTSFICRQLNDWLHLCRPTLWNVAPPLRIIHQKPLKLQFLLRTYVNSWESF